MERFWSFFFRKRAFTCLLVAALAAGGLYSLAVIPKESAPEVQIPVAVVTTVFPGASAFEVERLVTKKIEDTLAGALADLNKLTSSSREGVSVVTAEFASDADLEKSIADTKDAIDRIKNELPEDAEDPVVAEVNFVDQPFLLLSIESDLPPREFTELAEEIADEVQAIPGVSRVAVSGVRPREVTVIVGAEKLAQFGLRLPDVVASISAANSRLPIGAIRLNGVEYAIDFRGDVRSAEGVGSIVVAERGGLPVYLSDIALVSDGVGRTESFSRVSIGGASSEPSISLSVFKRRGGDVTELSKRIRARLAELEETKLKGSEVLISFDAAEFLREDLKNLAATGVQTTLLVMGSLVLAVGWREALIAGSAIPLSFLVAFIGLFASGNTVNFVSLFSLILGIGILVDSAIVVTEAVHTKMKAWKDKATSALETIREFHAPLTAGTATTLAVFVPLFFISGIVGKFIAGIPFTVIFLLSASLAVALGVIPTLAAMFLRRRTEGSFERAQEEYAAHFRAWYARKLGAILGNRARERWLIGLVVALFAASLSLPFLGAVTVTFFPQQDSPFLFIDIEKPAGSVLGETDLSVREVEEVLYGIPEITSFVTTIGESSPFKEPVRDSRFGNITALLLDEDSRERTSTEILEEVRRKVSGIGSATVRVFQDTGGPPVGAPILLTFSGDDLDRLETAAAEAERILAATPGTAEVRSDTRENGVEFYLEIDRAHAAELGVSPALVAETLRTAIHGAEATTISAAGADDVDVVVKLDLNPVYLDPDDTARVNLDDLRALEIAGPRGPVLLGSLLSTGLAKNVAVVRHEGRKRIARVLSEVAPGATVGEILAKVEASGLRERLPEGVALTIGGENEETERSFRDMFVALIAGVILMVAVLLLEFNSFRHAFYTIATVPLSLIGIFAGLALTGRAFSFPAMLGFIALAGIVVNNAIILIDVMNAARRADPARPLRDVVIEGAASRLRPIILTTATTIIGVVPLIFVSEIWAPIAFSIMFGLSFAFVLTLILIPVLYHRSPGPAGPL